MSNQSPGYGDTYRQQHAEEQRDAAAEAQAREDANAAARKTRLAGLDAAKRARAEEDEARIEESLTPDRERERRRWLAEHPDKGAADFYRHAWPQLRLNILEARDAATREETRQALLRSGRYSAL